MLQRIRSYGRLVEVLVKIAGSQKVKLHAAVCELGVQPSSIIVPHGGNLKCDSTSYGYWVANEGCKAVQQGAGDAW